MALPSTPRTLPRPALRCIYVNCFGSHPCGSAILYEGRGCWRLQRHEAGSSPWGVEALVPSAGPSPSPSRSRELAWPETPASLASSQGTPGPSQGTAAPRPRKQPKPRGRDGGPSRPLPGPENVSDAFDLCIPLNEAAKITKKKKKIQKRSCSILSGPFKRAVWDSVYKVISKMLNENEKIRDRMNFKQGCVENGDLTQTTEEESSHL